jgi:hypothetical protein
MPIEYPSIFRKVAGIAADVVKRGGAPIRNVASGARLLRAVDEMRFDKNKGIWLPISAHDARRIINNEKSDNRFTGAEPTPGGYVTGVGGLYLTEGLSTLGNEAIYYRFKDELQTAAFPGAPPSQRANIALEDHADSRMRPFSDAIWGRKAIYTYELRDEKRCVDLRRGSPFMTALLRDLGADGDIKDIMKRERAGDVSDLLFHASDNSVSRAVGSALLKLPGIEGMSVESVRNYFASEDRNVILLSETSEGMVTSLDPRERTDIIPNRAIEGAENVVVTDISGGSEATTSSGSEASTSASSSSGGEGD